VGQLTNNVIAAKAKAGLEVSAFLNSYFNFIKMNARCFVDLT
jgi:hypothetical protein